MKLIMHSFRLMIARGYVVYRVHLGSSKFDKIQSNKHEIDSWYADIKVLLDLGYQLQKKMIHLWPPFGIEQIKV